MVIHTTPLITILPIIIIGIITGGGLLTTHLIIIHTIQYIILYIHLTNQVLADISHIQAAVSLQLLNLPEDLTIKEDYM